ncbi:Uncharacterised protein [BD1-7 clade bacterium]|uniref:DUF4260 domain-containing protein n=1 Tax=BD1-7 clade bacterium TaxID=2029982 RepID=A0A5S9PB58_9GAMM|nr:Uncharacterised protein [BD1-7 clade bacterium]
MEAIGKIKVILRFEGAAILMMAALAYYQLSFSWVDFAWMFFIPDIALLAYLYNTKLGCISYNLTHSLIGALLVLTFGFTTHLQLGIQAGLIWVAHIGFDRALGYGLKYSQGFSYTHLGKIGNQKHT